VRLDASLARTRLGWAPRLDLDTALQSVVHFARADQAGEDLREVALAQLDAFVARGAPAAATRRAETAGAR
jgi:CDP-glucose 4,6-dehydratase